MTEKNVHVLEGKRWVWTGTSWYGEKTYEAPSAVIRQKLDAIIRPERKKQDASITDFQELLELAKTCKNAGDYERAETLLRQALQQNPGHAGALSVFCSVLRARQKPDEAVTATDAISARSGYGPLLTCRAAALCDLERWDEAFALVKRVLAGGAANEAVFAVRRRIRATRRDLFVDGDDE